MDGSWSRRKALMLLKVLASRGERRLHREALLDILWPELDAAAALNNLHKNLHYIRSALTAAGVTESLVTLRSETVELAGGTQLDVDRFRDAASEALGADDLALLEEAARLYKGDFLPEDVFEPWAAQDREALRALAGRVLHRLAAAYEGAGRTDDAIETLQRLLRSDVLNEEAHCHLIALYARSGSRHRALRQFQVLRDLLREELQVEPSEAARSLYEQLLAGDGSPQDLAPGVPPSVRVSRPETRPLRPPFGRHHEIESLQDLLEEAMAGRGRAVLVRGEAGIGKTHLIEHVLAAAEDNGCLVLTAKCSQLEASVAYQPFRDLLTPSLSLPGAGDFVRHSIYLRRVLLGTNPGDETPRDSKFFQSELFAEVHKLVQTLSQAKPSVLCIEDIHEADEDSLRLLHFLARRIGGDRVLVLCSRRSEGLDRKAQLGEMEASLRREGLLTEIELGRLDDQSMALLVEQLFGDGPVEPHLLREVLSRSEGNPLFATELVHTFIQEGWARQMDGRWARRGSGASPVPSAVHELLDVRFRRLSGAAQAELQLAAVHGREIDFPVMRAVLALSEREALDALDECIESNILEETRDGYKFRHDLLREAIYQRLTRARRQTLHKQLAEALEGLSGQPDANAEAIGRHFALSDEPYRAVGYLIDSGRRASALYANEQAAALLEQALAIIRDHPHSVDPIATASLRELLGDVERRRGNAARSVELFQEAYDAFLAAGDSEAATRARGKAALGHIMLGRADMAKELITATLRDLTEQSPSQVVSRTYYLLAQLHWHSGENRQALEAAERSLVAATAGGDEAELAQAYEVMALACHSLGDWQRGVELELERQAVAVPGFNIDEAFEAHL